MTPLRTQHAAAVAEARATNEHRARRKIAYLPPAVLAARGGQLVAAVLPQQADGPALITLTSFVAYSFCADTVSVAFNGYQGAADGNPATGRPWQPSEMQTLAEDADAIARGWVREALTVWSGNRAGDSVGTVLGYRIKRRTVLWDEPIPFGGGDQGRLPEEFAKTMRGPTALQAMAAAGVPARGVDADGRDALTRMDIAAADTFRRHDLPPELQNVLSSAHVVLWAPAGSPRAEALRTQLPNVEIRSTEVR